ncbi:MAG: fasciclin domain-containing protein [Flavobacteriales bacterium]
MFKHTLLMPLLFLGLFLNAQTTVVDVVVGSDDHTLLEAAVLEADLAGALSGDGPFTVFAPTDAAFTALVTALDITADDLLAMDNLGDILQYHVLGAEVLSTSLMAEQTVTMLNGDEATITSMGGAVMINGVAMVTAADITADNGVVHVIDAVLLPPTEVETTTVVDVIVNSDDHTLLEAAVGAADLIGALSGEGPFTVFAPTDAAITALVTALEITADDLLAMENLGDILTYHVLAGTVLSTDLAPTQTVTMLNGDEATVTSMDGTVMINDATVTMADITTDNGVVHVIDAVILPPVETTTVADIIAGSDDHFVLNAVLDSTGLDETLAGEGPFTVFAPTDAAFDAIDPFVLLDLLTDNDALAEILTYHVAGGTVLSTDLSDGQTITTVNGADVTVSVMDGTVMINDATVIVADLVADNGVVHVIDVVLTVPDPAPSTVVDIIVNSPDHNLLELAVGAAGLVDALSGEGPFTVFAPTDAAITALVAALEITADELLALETLGDILKYHVVGAAALSTDLSDGQLLTTLQGDDVEISIDMGVMVNDANVIVADLVADNGVVHVIDAVLSLPSGVDQVNLADLFNVYPNPTVDAVRWNGVQVDRLQVVDAEGRTRIETTNPINTIDLSSLESGLFFLVIEAEGQRTVKSVLKQ